MDAAGRGVEAADVMDEAARVHERVLVRSAHLDAVIVIADAMTARGTHECVLADAHPVAHRLGRRSAVSLSIEPHETSVE